MSMKKLFKLTLSLVLLAGIHLQGEAQINNSLYFMHGVPQSNRINPAHQPNVGFYIGFPAVAPRVAVRLGAFVVRGRAPGRGPVHRAVAFPAAGAGAARAAAAV